MTLAYWCVLIALILPYSFTMIAKVGGRMPLRYNHNPREFLAGASGMTQRANWAQMNSFEVTPAFAAAVIIAHQIGSAPQSTLDHLAIYFVISRVLYGVCYLADWPSLRTLVWTTGMALIVGFFVVSA